MNTQEIPVLLTSSIIAYDPNVSLSQTDARLHFTLKSIEQWLSIDPQISLVLCDGSSFDFKSIVSEKFPFADIECLHFENDQKLVHSMGRGYGEGEIVRFALENSHKIQQAGCFAKCSAKLWVANFKECRNDWNDSQVFKGVFSDVFSIFKKTALDYIDTRFYIISLSEYKKLYINAHLQIDIANNDNLEKSFLRIFQKNGIKNSFFSVAPVIEGVGGGIGFSYQNPLRRRIKESIRLKIVMQDSKFSDLFVTH